MSAPYLPYLPDDFSEFWQDAVLVAMGAPLDGERGATNFSEVDTHVVEKISYRGIDGTRIQGWLATPPGARQSKAFVWTPPYGRESLLPNQYGTRQGYASLSFNFFGLEAFHQEKYRIDRGYFAEGAGDPETWVFRSMFQNAVLATRVLQAQIEVDEDRIGAMGMSQGGGISIWLGAWCPIIKAVAADMPFLAAVKNTLMQQVYRYPLKELSDFIEQTPLGEERVFNTVSYFDTMNQATQCKVPTQISLGLKDPACKPDTVRSVYEALTGPKKLITYDWGHDWHPEMVANNQAWFDANL